MTARSNFETIRVETDGRGVATLTLARPDVHNAMNAAMMEEIPAAAAALEADDAVRAVVLTGEGETFCAGGDLKWMQGQRALEPAARIEGSRKIAVLLGALNNLPKPLIGRINGPAYGGGVGLMSVCDIVIAPAGAKFGLTEVKLGLIPANIGPYVVTRMGEANARQVFLNARLFDAGEARGLGLVSQVVFPEELDGAVEREIGFILKCGPEAVGATKRLIAQIARDGAAGSIDYAMEALAEAWERGESAEGIDAFFAKRPPNWDPKAEK